MIISHNFRNLLIKSAAVTAGVLLGSGISVMAMESRENLSKNDFLYKPQYLGTGIVDVERPVIEDVKVPIMDDSELPVKAISKADIELLAKVVEAEAGNQGIEGKRLVTDVILNRVDSDIFPDNIHDVIYQKNQFSVVGYIDSVVVTDETFAAIESELIDRINWDIVYFNAVGFMYGKPWMKVGGHYFSTEVKK